MIAATAPLQVSRGVSGVAPLRLFRPPDPAAALGMAANYLRNKPAFANQRFGDWTDVLIGQINRGHYYFVLEGNRVRGFIGWGLTTRAKAEAWVEGRRSLSLEECLQGDCVILNAWSADSTRVTRFLLDEARKSWNDKQTLYFKRYYKDGRVRPARLNVNDFVTTHVPQRAVLSPEPAHLRASTSPRI